ncbi:MAG: Rrf2 family transcriptional regulator [Verrucomicrobiales bacterium]
MHHFLSQTAEYALRAMSWLAIESPEAAVRARDLSEGSGIPAHYLAKVLRRLVLAGLLESQKGLGGGFSLSREPSEILFSDILKAVDAYPSLDRCAFGWGECDAEKPCPLHESWAQLGELFCNWATRTTLADTASDTPLEMRRLLRGKK